MGVPSRLNRCDCTQRYNRSSRPENPRSSTSRHRRPSGECVRTARPSRLTPVSVSTTSSGGSIASGWLSAADDTWAVARTSKQVADRWYIANGSQMRFNCGRPAGQEGVVFVGDHVVESNRAAAHVNAIHQDDWAWRSPGLPAPLPCPPRVGGRAQGGGPGGAAWSCPRG
jgi:hypothetical protein